MKFIHIADMHLDRSFEGLGKLPNELLTKVVKQNQLMLKKMVDTAIAQQVDFVLIVGDTFHQPTVSIQTQHLFISEMTRLAQAQVPVVLSFGNHDYFTANKYWFPFPENVHVIKTEAVTTFRLTTKKHEKIAISGFSYRERWLAKSKAQEFPRRYLDVDYHIGLYHGAQGQVVADAPNYAPFSLRELKAAGYDYWALGHVHQPTILSSQPPVIYAGSPLGHTKKEKESRGFIIAQTCDKQLTYEWQELGQVSWHEEAIDLASAKDLTELLILMREGLISLTTALETVHFVKVTLLGSQSELGSSVQQELASGGMLAYLQERVYEQSGFKVWVYQVVRQLDEQQLQLPLGVSVQLLNQLNQRYQEKAVFEAVMSELYQQNELRSFLPKTGLFRAELIANAQTRLLQDLGLDREVKL